MLKSRIGRSAALSDVITESVTRAGEMRTAPASHPRATSIVALERRSLPSRLGRSLSRDSKLDFTPREPQERRPTPEGLVAPATAPVV